MANVSGQLGPTLERMDYGRALKGELLMNTKSDLQVPYAQPLIDAVLLFDSLQIAYALIGGIASMYYGRARFTEDVDFVAMTGQMEIFSAHPDEMEKYHFAPEYKHKLYHKSGLHVDLWKDEHADEIIRRAVEVELAGQKIKIIEPHDLIAMKLRAHRLKDDYDISQIVFTTRIDADRISSMVTDEQFAHFNQIKSRK